jgi:hypothetical protein
MALEDRLPANSSADYGHLLPVHSHLSAHRGPECRLPPPSVHKLPANLQPEVDV